MSKTKAQLEAELTKEREKLAALEAAHRAKLADVAALKELAAASLAAAPMGDLEKEARRQAQAETDARAAEKHAGELARRIGEQRAAIAEAEANVKRADLAEMDAAAAALIAELRGDLAALAPKFERLGQLGNRRAALDAAIAKMAGYPGTRFTDPSGADFENIGRRLIDFLQLEQTAAQRRAELVSEGAERNRRIAAAEAKVGGPRRADRAPGPAVIIADQSFAV